MTAKGKVTAARLKPGMRIMLSTELDSKGNRSPSVTKVKGAVAATVETVWTQTVWTQTAERGQRVIKTDIGTVHAAPAQTFWLAKPE